MLYYKQNKTVDQQKSKQRKLWLLQKMDCPTANIKGEKAQIIFIKKGNITT